ncbi:MAG: YicC family protein [Clostridiales bacterium]|nr:YicC family protein [Clostridiales bacterium]
MRSMTGYGRGECTLHNRKFVVEIKSVNHRYNDISVKIPRTMISFEDYVKKIVSKQIFRGKTDVYVSFETYDKNDIKINLNEVIADSYIEALENIKIRYGAHDDISVGLISRFPEVLTVERNSFENSDENEISEPLFNAVGIALSNFMKMRESEGEALKKNIYDKLNSIDEKVKFVNERAPYAEKRYEERLRERLKELEDMGYDESRILTEVAVFSEKVCVDEEITRLMSHISQMRLFLEETEPVGRKLDFLIQEMNREVNTIGSKTTDLSVTNTVIEIKSEIEKVREQIQNIE